MKTQTIGEILQPILDTLAEKVAKYLAEKITKQLAESNQHLGKADEKEFLNLEKAAKFLDVSKSTLYKMTSKKKIPFYKRGKQLRFKLADLDGWIEEGKQEVQATSVQSNLSINF